MGDKVFWDLIESAWQSVGGMVESRDGPARREEPLLDAELLMDALDTVVGSLGDSLDQLSAEDLLAFDRILERKLYDIDRREVHDHIGGSDDRFLFARGFIVALGKRDYDAVNANSAITFDALECESICYISFHLYNDKFGEMPRSGISRESTSNFEGWRDA